MAPDGSPLPAINLVEVRSAMEQRLAMAWQDTWDALDNAWRQGRPLSTAIHDESSTSSQGSDDDDNPAFNAPHGPKHRTSEPSKGALKPSSGPKATRSNGATVNLENIQWAPDEQLQRRVAIAQCLDLREQLWFDQPEANVACETCGKRVSLKEGRLRAEPGRPQFMLEEFYCGDCALDTFDLSRSAALERGEASATGSALSPTRRGRNTSPTPSGSSSDSSETVRSPARLKKQAARQRDKGKTKAGRSGTASKKAVARKSSKPLRQEPASKKRKGDKKASR